MENNLSNADSLFSVFSGRLKKRINLIPYFTRLVKTKNFNINLQL
jgi:hypothetical protein